MRLYSAVDAGHIPPLVDMTTLAQPAAPSDHSAFSFLFRVADTQ